MSKNKVKTPKINTPSNAVVLATKVKESKEQESTHKPPFFTDKNAFFILLGLLFVGCFFVFKYFLLQNKLFLFKDIGSDTMNQIYPFAQMISNKLKSGFPTWSFQQGLGQYVAPFNMGNPFHLLLYFFGGSDLAVGIGYLEFFKFILAGLVFYAFLNQLKLSPVAKLLGGLVYGLSGFLAITSGWYTFFSGWAIEFAFLLFAIERLLQKNEWYFLPIAIAVVATDQPFNLLLFSEFCLAYLLVKFFIQTEQNFKVFGKNIMKIIACGILGLLISSVIFTGNMHAILNSPRVTGGASYVTILASKPIFETVDATQLFTEITRFFGDNLTGIGNKYQGWQNYMEGPTFYLGLFSLLLFPQIFVLTDARRRKVFGILTGIVFISLIFPYFRYLFWAFSGDYYRLFSLFVGVAILLSALFALTKMQEGKKLNVWLLIGTFLFLVLLLFYKYLPQWEEIIQKGERARVAIFLLLLTILLLVYNATRKEIVLAALIALTFVEITYSAYQTLNSRDIVSASEWRERVGYHDYTKEVLAYIQNHDKSFYRVEKDYSSSTSTQQSANDAMVQGYRGTAVYTAFNNKSQILYMAGMGALNLQMESETRWAGGLKNRPFLLGNVGVKYVLSRGQATNKNFGYDSLTKIEDITIFKNPNVLPMGVTYDSFYVDSYFKKLSLLQKDLGVMRGFVIDDQNKAIFKGLTEIKDSISTLNLDFVKKTSAERKQDTLQISSFSDTHFDGKIELQRQKLLYLSIPYDDGWKAIIDGKQTETHIVSYGMTGVLLDKGKHDVKLYYEAPYLKASAYLSLLGLLLWAGGVVFFVRKKYGEDITKETVL